MRRFLVYLLAGLLLPAAARALTVVPRSFDELVARSDTAFKGTVTTVSPQWTGTGAERHIVTFVTFRVEETYKGDAAGTRTLRFFGGTVDGVTMEVPEVPRFAPGQVAVLFETGNGQIFCPLVGVHQGRFHVARDGAGVERVTTDDGSPVTSTAEIGQLEADGTPVLRRHALAHEPGMTLDGFRTEVCNKAAALAAHLPGTAPVNQPQP